MKHKHTLLFLPVLFLLCSVAPVEASSFAIYFDSEFTSDEIVGQPEWGSVFEAWLVLEDVPSGIHGWEVRIDIPYYIGVLPNWELVQPGTAIGGEYPDLEWIVELDECALPDENGKIPVLHFFLYCEITPSLDTTVSVVAADPSSVEPPLPAYMNCEEQPIGVAEIHPGVVNPRDPSCLVFPHYLDFGYVALGDSVRREFSITNHFVEETLQGTIVGLNSHFFVDGNNSYSLSPGQTQFFTVVYAPLSRGPQNCTISVLDEPWICSVISIDGYCGSAIVLSFDPVFRRSLLMYPYPPFALFHVWVGIGGVREARGWAAGFDIPPEFTVLEYKSLQQASSLGGAPPSSWIVEFSECLEILPGDVLPVARLTLVSWEELQDSYRFETRPYEIGSPAAWFDCQNVESPVLRSGVAEITGPVAGGSVQPVAVPEATPPMGSIPLSVAFQANAYDTDGPQEELIFYWLFGDGTYSIEANPQHDYVEPGNYSVWLNVFDGVSDVNNSVFVNATPSSSGSIPGPARQQQLLLPSPNPFNPQTRLDFILEQNTHVQLTIYDMAGHRIAVLLDEFMPAGQQTARWDGKDTRGRTMPSGSYLVRLSTDQGVSIQKMLLAK